MFLRDRKGRGNDQSDAELIERYKKLGDGADMAELFRRHRQLVFCVCLKYLRNADESHDAVMSIFAKLIQDLKTHEFSNFKGWLYVVTRNHCRMTLRMRSREREAVLADGWQNLDNNDVDMLDDVDAEFSVRDLKSALEKLNEPQRDCIRLFYLEQMSYREVATATSFTIKQVKSYIQNGKRNLRRMLLGRKGRQFE